MDQHTARPDTSPTGPTGPTGGNEAAAGVYRAPRPGPRARLTGLGTGALITVLTVLGGLLDSAVLDGPGVLFGLVFVTVSVLGALCVRRHDLVAAPISAPIAFAAGITVTADGGAGGLAGHLLGVITGLATMTGWLYTGTALAALIAGVRALRLPSRRRRSRRYSAARRGRSGR